MRGCAGEGVLRGCAERVCCGGRGERVRVCCGGQSERMRVW